MWITSSNIRLLCQHFFVQSLFTLRFRKRRWITIIAISYVVTYTIFILVAVRLFAIVFLLSFSNVSQDSSILLFSRFRCFRCRRRLLLHDSFVYNICDDSEERKRENERKRKKEENKKIKKNESYVYVFCVVMWLETGNIK